MFDPAFPVSKLRPAEYNPRRIDQEAREALRRSIKLVGFGKPLIVLADGLTVAGHQRGDAARALGLETVPAFVVRELVEADEVRFNQLHNGTDLDDCDPQPSIAGAVPAGYSMLPVDRIICDTRATGVAIRGSMMRLLLKYGNWGAAIIADGEVLSGANYLLSCSQLRLPARVFGISASIRKEALELLRRPYGVFSYDHLFGQTPWRQSFAQPNRLGGKRGAKQNESHLYRSYLLPDLRKGERLLDFGSGRGAYPRRLRAMGHRVVDVEFFRRARGSNRLDKPAVHRMIDNLIASLRSDGLFDRVVCEAVINSVDSPESASDVFRCVAAFCRRGGRVYVSGRTREIYETYARSKQYAARGTDWNPVGFIDEHGFTGTYHHGGWFYQLVHSEAEATALVEASFGPVVKAGSSTSCWQRAADLTVTVDLEEAAAAIRREFDLAWPEGETVNRGRDVEAAWRAALE